MKRKTVTRLVCVALAAVMMTAALSFAPATVQSVEAGGFGCGSTATGQITDGDYGYFDYWYFSGTANDKVTITMTRTSGNLNPMVRLYFSQPTSSDFKWLATAESTGGNSSVVISNFTLPTTGTYSINTRRTAGREGTTTGDYNMTLTCSGGLSSCPQLGTVWEGMIAATTYYNKIETKDGDFWAFRADPGKRVRIDVSSSDFKPFVGLYQYESKWQLLAYGVEVPPPTPAPGTTQYVPPSYLIDTKLDKSGCYYVWVTASGSSQRKTGSYALLFNLK